MLILEDRLALLATLSLRHGSHDSVEEGMCVMEAVAFVAGEPHTDVPTCACPVIASFMRSWNDGLPDDAHRNLYLKRFIPRLVGSRACSAVAERRSYLALDWLIRVHTPAWLDLVESTRPHAAAVRALGEIVDMESAIAAGPVVRAVFDVARAAAGDVAWDVARDVAWDTAGDAARAAAGDAARAAAGHVAWAGAKDVAWDVARAVARDAARDALRPTVVTLQESAVVLVERMLNVSA